MTNDAANQEIADLREIIALLKFKVETLENHIRWHEDEAARVDMRRLQEKLMEADPSLT